MNSDDTGDESDKPNESSNHAGRALTASRYPGTRTVGEDLDLDALADIIPGVGRRS